MTALFVCGVVRVVLVAAYCTLVFAERDAAVSLLVPAALLTLAVAIYDAVGQARRNP